MGVDHQATDAALVWISEVGRKDANAARSNRRKVRQQAMRHVVATQHRVTRTSATFKFVDGFPKSSSAGEYIPDMEEIVSARPSDGHKANPSIKRWIVHVPKRKRDEVLALRPLAQTGYLKARAKYGFDILDLCMFASVHMGRAAATAMHNSRSKMKHWLQAREPSFLDFIPSLYATSSLLGKAVDCVLARGRSMLNPDTQSSDATVYTLYGLALREVQEALGREDRRYDSDVLCSVQVLQLFEVLDFSRSDPWTRHTSGIARLIQMRGPGRYRTEFDQSMLCSQLGTIFGEALLQNKDCFLGEPQWQAILNEIVSRRDSKMLPLLIGLWSFEMRLPRLIRETSEVVVGGDRDEQRVAALNSRLHHFRSLSLRWRSWALDCTDSAEQEAYKLSETLAIAYGGDILANRALVTLNPLDPKAERIEAETIELAEQITQIAERLRMTTNRGDAMIARTIQVAAMARACRDDYGNAMRGHADYIDESTGHVAVKVWQRFNGMMGRRVMPGFVKREDLLRDLARMDCWLLAHPEPERYLDGTIWTSGGGVSPILMSSALISETSPVPRVWDN